MTGSITDLGNTVKVNARLIGVESAKVFAVAATKIPKVGIVEKLMAKAAASSPVLTTASSQGTTQTSYSKVDQRTDKEKAAHDRRVAAAKAAVVLEKELEAACPERIDRGRHIPAGYKHDSRSNGICRCGSPGC
ncbi:MAG: hypothetical protein Q7T53_09210 [Deltaproteobacteria bacterium]|nr:hypothetical protein [Deltaproteobacteria bacterium]